MLQCQYKVFQLPLLPCYSVSTGCSSFLCSPVTVSVQGGPVTSAPLLQCQDTVVQFISFLSLQLSTEELLAQLPSVDELLTQYHIPSDVTFALWRPLHSAAIAARYEDLRKGEKKDKAASSSQTNKVGGACAR